MKSSTKKKVAVVGAVVASAAILLYAFPRAYGGPGPYTVVIQVVSSSNPLPNASVQIDNGVTYVSDINGMVTFTNVAKGTHTFSASLTGYMTNTITQSVNADSSYQISLNASSGGGPYNVLVTVTDSFTASLIAGASVILGGLQGTTDSSGKVTINSVPAGTYALGASAAGYESFAQAVTVDASHTSFAIQLMRASVTFTVTVTDAGSVLPIQNATVSYDGSSTSTDLNGVASISTAVPTSQLTITANGHFAVVVNPFTPNNGQNYPYALTQSGLTYSLYLAGLPRILLGTFGSKQAADTWIAANRSNYTGQAYFLYDSNNVLVESGTF